MVEGLSAGPSWVILSQSIPLEPQLLHDSICPQDEPNEKIHSIKIPENGLGQATSTHFPHHPLSNPTATH